MKTSLNKKYTSEEILNLVIVLILCVSSVQKDCNQYNFKHAALTLRNTQGGKSSDNILFHSPHFQRHTNLATLREELHP